MYILRIIKNIGTYGSVVKFILLYAITISPTTCSIEKERTFIELKQIRKIDRLNQNSEADGSVYKEKEIIKAYHHIIKKILPPYPGDLAIDNNEIFIQNKIKQQSDDIRRAVSVRYKSVPEATTDFIVKTSKYQNMDHNKHLRVNHLKRPFQNLHKNKKNRMKNSRKKKSRQNRYHHKLNGRRNIYLHHRTKRSIPSIRTEATPFPIFKTPKNLDFGKEPVNKTFVHKFEYPTNVTSEKANRYNRSKVKIYVFDQKQQLERNVTKMILSKKGRKYNITKATMKPKKVATVHKTEDNTSEKAYLPLKYTTVFSKLYPASKTIKTKYHRISIPTDMIIDYVPIANVTKLSPSSTTRSAYLKPKIEYFTSRKPNFWASLLTTNMPFPLTSTAFNLPTNMAYPPTSVASLLPTNMASYPPTKVASLLPIIVKNVTDYVPTKTTGISATSRIEYFPTPNFKYFTSTKPKFTYFTSIMPKSATSFLKPTIIYVTKPSITSANTEWRAFKLSSKVFVQPTVLPKYHKHYNMHNKHPNPHQQHYPYVYQEQPYFYQKHPHSHFETPYIVQKHPYFFQKFPYVHQHNFHHDHNHLPTTTLKQENINSTPYIPSSIASTIFFKESYMVSLPKFTQNKSSIQFSQASISPLMHFPYPKPNHEYPYQHYEYTSVSHEQPSAFFSPNFIQGRVSSSTVVQHNTSTSDYYQPHLIWISKFLQKNISAIKFPLPKTLYANDYKKPYFSSNATVTANNLLAEMTQPATSIATKIIQQTASTSVELTKPSTSTSTDFIQTSTSTATTPFKQTGISATTELTESKIPPTTEISLDSIIKLIEGELPDGKIELATREFKIKEETFVFEPIIQSNMTSINDTYEELKAEEKRLKISYLLLWLLSMFCLLLVVLMAFLIYITRIKDSIYSTYIQQEKPTDKKFYNTFKVKNTECDISPTAEINITDHRLQDDIKILSDTIQIALNGCHFYQEPDLRRMYSSIEHMKRMIKSTK